MTGCVTSHEIETQVETLTPEVPAIMLTPLEAPTARVASNRDLLQLLADYEALRRRANADRAGIAEIMRRMEEHDSDD